MAGYQGTSTRRHPAEALFSAIESEVREVNTNIDGTIVEYDRTTQLAKVQPNLTRTFGKKTLRAPVLEQIKINQPKAGGHGVHVEPKVGDPVVLHARQRNTDTSQTQGGDTSGYPGRMFDLSDCYATPGGGDDAKTMTNMPAGEAHFGKADGKAGLRSKDSGAAAVKGGPGGGEKFIVAADGRVDIKGENGDSALQILRDFLVQFRLHTNGGAPLDAGFVTQTLILIGRIDDIKAP